MSNPHNGLGVKFWFEAGDGLWHGKVSTQEFSGATLEDVLKQGMELWGNVGGMVSNPCLFVPLSSRD